MWPFNKKFSLAESGLFRGMTEYHCHLLPGVDDGVRTMEESLQLLEEFEKAGIQTVWLTPHIMEDIPNTTAQLNQRFEELKSCYTGSITLNLAAENMLDNLFDKRLAEGDVPTIIDGSHLLVETSYFNPPMDMDKILRSIQSKGFIPLLAHPERYIYMEQSDYLRLKSMNIEFQLNLPSLAGCYGTRVQRKAETLLTNGLYEYAGTDTHSLPAWKTMFETPNLTKVTLNNLQNLLSRHSSR